MVYDLSSCDAGEDLSEDVYQVIAHVLFKESQLTSG